MENPLDDGSFEPRASLIMPSKTFEEFDVFGLGLYADRLERFLLVEKDYIEGSLVVGLDAPFGSGKSTFLEMWSTRLAGKRSAGETCPIPVTLNAWESDHCSDPMIAILAELIAAVDRVKGDEVPNTNKLKEAAKDFGWLMLSAGNDLANGAIGVDFCKGVELATKKKAERNAPKPSIIDLHLLRMEALSNVREELRLAFGASSSQVLLFVDELDRCRPDYAIAYLEAIKHMFDVDGLTFVLAFDLSQLANSAKTLFGQSLNFDEYLRKFCHRVFTLPLREEQHVRNLAVNYGRKFLVLEGKRSSMIPLNDTLIRKATELIHSFRANPRQVQEAFRILGHTMATEDEQRKGNLKWGYVFSGILLSFIRVLRPELFREIVAGDATPLTVGNLLISVLGRTQGEWWIMMVFSGWRDVGNEEKLMILHQLGFTTVGPSVFDGFSDAYSYSEANQILRLARLIDGADRL